MMKPTLLSISLAAGATAFLTVGEAQTGKPLVLGAGASTRTAATPNARWTQASFAPIELVKGAPYSAEKTIEGVRKASDGKHIPEIQPSFLIYRDSSGRIRKEAATSGVRDQGGLAIEIDDPVEGARYSLDAENKIAHRIRVRVKETSIPGHHQVPPQMSQAPNQPRIQVAILGMRAVEGIKTIGERTTVIWPAHSLGNAEPRTIVTEKWFSPELKVVMLWKSSDPQSSITEMLTHVERQDPDPKLFQIPPDYKIVDDNVNTTASSPVTGSSLRSAPGIRRQSNN